MSNEKYVVAIVGGACAGSEAANVLANLGVHCVVIEQNPRPFGKIEDGLPRWHVKQRKKEYEKISQKLDRPEVDFVPLTVLGKDLTFDELAKGWGLTAVLLANGAWRDRPLVLPGVDAYVGKGLVYQNPFVYWFNHFLEKGYAGEEYPVPDGVAVIGGGLASIDVVKILQVELVRRHLVEKKKIEVDMHDLEREGIPKVLAKHGLTYESLGLRGCTLYYRRRSQDMPLAEYPDDADEKAKEKTHNIRKKILGNVVEKFLFKFEERHLPTAAVIEGGRLAGIEFVRTEIVDGKPKNIPGSNFKVTSPMVVSSIGSIPAVVPGLPMKGETCDVEDWDTGKMRGYENVWGLGNVVTGKGNIQASLKHGRFVAELVARQYLGLEGELDRDDLYKAQEQAAAASATKVAAAIRGRLAPLSADRVAGIAKRVRERQKAVGYDGNFRGWLAKVTPPDME